MPTKLKPSKLSVSTRRFKPKNSKNNTKITKSLPVYSSKSFSKSLSVSTRRSKPKNLILPEWRRKALYTTNHKGCGCGKKIFNGV
jgi:hypothetical protein